jgi:RNA polymerase sigma factor (sigma-70 family)
MKPHLFADEKDIVDGLREGDNLAVKVLYKNHYPAVLNYILKNNGNTEVAKEIYQQAFVVLVEKLQDEKFTLSASAGTFLFAVSKNLWLAQLKERKRFSDKDADAQDFVNIPLDMNEILIKEEQFSILYKCLDEIGESCKKLLSGFYLDQKTMETLAAELGYTNSDNAKNQKYKCLQRLKKLFKAKQS